MHELFTINTDRINARFNYEIKLTESTVSNNTTEDTNTNGIFIKKYSSHKEM